MHVVRRDDTVAFAVCANFTQIEFCRVVRKFCAYSVRLWAKTSSKRQPELQATLLRCAQIRRQGPSGTGVSCFFYCASRFGSVSCCCCCPAAAGKTVPPPTASAHHKPFPLHPRPSAIYAGSAPAN